VIPNARFKEKDRPGILKPLRLAILLALFVI
jgi:hypothetical protein